MANLLAELKSRVLISDGGIGTEIMARGAPKGALGESLNLTHPEIVKAVHRAYAEAGSDFIKTNTFSSHRLKLAEFGLEDKFKEINEEGIKLAREASGGAFVNACMGALGGNVEPLGKLTYDQVYVEYFEWAKTLSKADSLSLETMSDIKMFKAAFNGARDACPKTPILGMMTFDENGRTVFGTPILTALSVYEALGVDIVGAMCTTTPKHYLQYAELLSQNTSRPIALWPNGG